MIVPDFWAEARLQERVGKKQITIRRFGWSNLSQSDAQQMAESRAAEDMRRVLSGHKLERREPKLAYNGAVGVPIREEVISRHEEEVISRNSYGARCLNSPRVLFADIDFQGIKSTGLILGVFFILVIVAMFSGLFRQNGFAIIGFVIIVFIVASFASTVLIKLASRFRERPETLARKKIDTFLKENTDWNIRLYKTPAGLRLLATHRLFDADSADARKLFSAIDADPVYIRMCFNQKCFRARLTAKPWRIGISSHMRPRPGVWPVNPERMQERKNWIDAYEQRAASYAACHFIGNLGSGVIHKDVENIIKLHDEQCRALELDVPIA